MSFSRYDFWVILIFLSVFRMDGLIYLIPSMKVVYGALQAVVLLISFYILFSHRYPIKGQLTALTGLFFYLGAVTLFSSQSTEQVLSMVLSDYTMCVAAYGAAEKDLRRFLYRGKQVALFLLTINFINMLIMPQSLGLTRSSNKIFLLTSDNGLLKYMLIFCVIYELHSALFYVPLWRKWGFYVMCILQLLIGAAATSFFAFAVYLAGLFLIRKVPFTRLGTVQLVGILAANWFLLIFRKMELFASLVKLVGKNTTFSGRTLIWDAAMNRLSQMPFWGYGVTENTYYVIYKNTPMEAHNMILGILLQGGVILAAFWLGQILYLNRLAFRLDRFHAMNLIMLGLLSYGVMFLVESPPVIPGFFLLLVLGGKIARMPDFLIPRRKLRVLIHE
ncbi:MAG: O-antigen ligase family protein [Massiliimalia sp.]|jgi:O-antigen ligase